MLVIQGFSILTFCSSGSINYGHVSSTLESVDMDDTSNSVYLTTGTGHSGWQAFTGKGLGDNQCYGTNLGTIGDGCQNLNTAKGERIRCVYDPYS